MDPDQLEYSLYDAAPWKAKLRAIAGNDDATLQSMIPSAAKQAKR